MPAKVKSVERRSPARGKVFPGDTLLRINGCEIEDVLDYKFYSYDSELLLELKDARGGDKIVRILKDEGADEGIEFESYLMDSERACCNRCVFCFIDQLPKGVRKTLLFKDDDARLSFLLGNYVTLTNMSAREKERIIRLRVSPINISVHATDPELRVKMLRNKNAGGLMDDMRAFAAAGIQMNCQIVCCPGINDGEALKRSMKELAELYPAVMSVSVVPVGITKHREGLYPLTPCGKKEAGEILASVDAFGEECLKRLGCRLFYCADELYLRAGIEIPSEEYYEGYPQIENGVGLMRSTWEEFSSRLKTLKKASGEPFSVATGCAAAEFLTKIIMTAQTKCDNIKGKVFPVKNNFFGETVDVAGLVAGGDLIEQLRGRELGRRLLIPASMLRHGGDVFLDDVSLEDAERELGVRIVTVSNDGADIAEKIFDI